MGKPCLDRNGKPIYVMGGSDKYKENFDKIFGVKTDDKSSKDPNTDTSNSSNRDEPGTTGKPLDK